MNVSDLDHTGLGGLDLLEGLATPLWLLRFDGEAVWLNGAARALLDLPDAAPPGTVRTSIPAPGLAALRETGRHGSVRAMLGFRRGAAETAVETRLSLAGAGPGGLILAEAQADSVERQEVLRLTEQLVALSYAYPDMRFELRSDGTILDFAAVAPSDLNIPAERFLAARVQDVLPEPAGGLIAAALGRLAAGETVTGASFVLGGPGGGPGSDRHFEARLVRLMDGERILCSVRNVTERAMAEQAASRTHGLLVDAIESIADGFVVYDAEDRLVLCNRKYKEMYGLSGDLIRPGTLFEEILRAGARRGQYDVPARELEAWIAERLARHRKPGRPFEQRLADGRWIRVEERRTRDGGTVGLRSDVTDLKQREAELAAARDEAERANRRKSDYVHHLSHELRTPLNAVSGFSQILGAEMMGPLGNERYRDYALQISAAAVYMLDLINNLLDLAKIEAGRMELADQVCDIRELVGLTYAMMAQRAAAAGVALCDELPEELPGVIGDGSQIRQVLTNLVSNAIKFAKPGGGRVTVRAERTADGGLALSVADDGIGMAPEQIPKALDAFGQVHERASSGERGSGLGLPLSRALILLHGGRFHIDSSPGVGTTVRLTFPPSRVGCLMDGDGV